MQVSVSELQESLASFKKVCAAMVLCMMLTQMMLLYYVSAISYNNTATAKYAQYLLISNKQVLPLTQFFLFPLCENSLICLEGKSMTPHRGNTILFRSSQQLPRLRPSKGFLS